MTRTLFLMFALFVVSCGLVQAPAESAPTAAPAEIDLTQAGDSRAEVPGERAAFAPARGRPSRFQASSELIPIPSHNAVWGDGAAPVTIVSFSDYQCPYCGRVTPTLDALKRRYGPNRLRIVYKHLPLGFHKHAKPAARAAQAVLRHSGDGAFLEYSKLLFSQPPKLQPEQLARHAEQLGISGHVVLSALDDPSTLEEVEADRTLANRLGVSGTPGFMINGRHLSGAQSETAFAAIIDDELAQAATLRGTGASPETVYSARVATNFTPKDEASVAGPGVWNVPVGKSPVKGPKDALVTIVEFSDFECPFCSRVQPALARVLQEYPKEVRLVFKHHPLPFHKRAKAAARLTIEALKQKGHAGFWLAHEQLFAQQKRLDDADLRAVGAQLGLNAWRVNRALTSSLHDAALQLDEDLADDVNARGTPSFYINGRRFSGAKPYSQFKQLVDEELAKAQSAVASGTPRGGYYAHVRKSATMPKAPPKVKVAAPGKRSPTRGRAGAPVTIQVFSDFQCPYCKRAAATLDQVAKNFGSRVRIVWRHLPLSFHSQAQMASEAAQEVFRQKGSLVFWRFHDEVFKLQSQLSRQTVQIIAAKLGVNMTRFRGALDNGTHTATVNADAALARTAGISGTPAFVINGYLISGSRPYGEFKKTINRALKDKSLPVVP